jgi:hypothetical protein
MRIAIQRRGARDVQFLRTLRDPIRRGEITTTVRIWQRPHVKVGGHYALPPGEIVVTKIFEVPLSDVTPELARQSGFAGLVDLLKVAKHGAGRRVFVIEFRYIAGRSPPKKRGKT